MATTELTGLKQWARRQADAYRAPTGDPRPLNGYVASMGVYTAGVATLAAVVARRRAEVPRTVTPWDVALLGLATHKLSRTIAKDAVTSPLRAPFTTYEAAHGSAEVGEQVREHGGVKHAVGELITCPFCLAQWIATSFVAGWVVAPRLTRLASATMAGVAVSDFLQQAYAALQRVAE